MFVAIGLLALGAGGRVLLSGLANFETLMVTAFLAVMLLPLGRALLVTLVTLYVSDVAMGHVGLLSTDNLLPLGGILLFTYSGYALVALAGWLARRRAAAGLTEFNAGSVLKFTGFGILFTLVFDTWTNFGVFWFWYAHTPANLTLVYLLGVPFALMHLYSSVITFTLVGLPLWLTMRHRFGNDHTDRTPDSGPHDTPRHAPGPLMALLSRISLEYRISRRHVSDQGGR